MSGILEQLSQYNNIRDINNTDVRNGGWVRKIGICGMQLKMKVQGVVDSKGVKYYKVSIKWDNLWLRDVIECSSLYITHIAIDECNKKEVEITIITRGRADVWHDKGKINFIRININGALSNYFVDKTHASMNGDIAYLIDDNISIEDLIILSDADLMEKIHRLVLGKGLIESVITGDKPKKIPNKTVVSLRTNHTYVSTMSLEIIKNKTKLRLLDILNNYWIRDVIDDIEAKVNLITEKDRSIIEVINQLYGLNTIMNSDSMIVKDVDSMNGSEIYKEMICTKDKSITVYGIKYPKALMQNIGEDARNLYRLRGISKDEFAKLYGNKLVGNACMYTMDGKQVNNGNLIYIDNNDSKVVIMGFEILLAYTLNINNKPVHDIPIEHMSNDTKHDVDTATDGFWGNKGGIMVEGGDTLLKLGLEVWCREFNIKLCNAGRIRTPQILECIRSIYISNNRDKMVITLNNYNKVVYNTKVIKEFLVKENKRMLEMDERLSVYKRKLQLIGMDGRLVDSFGILNGDKNHTKASTDDGIRGIEVESNAYMCSIEELKIGDRFMIGPNFHQFMCQLHIGKLIVTGKGCKYATKLVEDIENVYIDTIQVDGSINADLFRAIIRRIQCEPALKIAGVSNTKTLRRLSELAVCRSIEHKEHAYIVLMKLDELRTG